MCVGIGGSLPQEMQRLVTASCLLSSHLGCQMCPFMGQDRWVLWHMSQPSWGTSSSLAPLVQRGRGVGVCVRTCGVGEHHAPLPAGRSAEC